MTTTKDTVRATESDTMKVSKPGRTCFDWRALMIGWIWLITAYDIWCTQWLTPKDELNPIALLLMVRFGVWAMVSFKVFGTYVATEWLRHLPTYYSIIMAALMLALLLILTGVIPL